MYTLTGPDGLPYTSDSPGTLGGYRRRRIYGRLDCPSALRAIAAGGYLRHRVFFADDVTAIAAGYRPCAVCLPGAYARWATANNDHMSAPLDDARLRSPLIRDLAVEGGEDPHPVPHTEAELAALLVLVAAPGWRVETVTVGYSRDAASRTAADAFIAAWQDAGKTVLAAVDWPEHAASWLRPARRFADSRPDAWVVAAAPLGWAQLARRLRHSTLWDPARTVGFASIGTIEALRLAGSGTLDGMRGVSANGGVWRIGRHSISHYPPTEQVA
jgi:hypothetical protein